MEYATNDGRAGRQGARATLHAVLLMDGEAPEPYTFDIGPPGRILGFRGRVADVLHLGMCDGHLVLADESEVHYYHLLALLLRCRGAVGDGPNFNAASACERHARAATEGAVAEDLERDNKAAIAELEEERARNSGAGAGGPAEDVAGERLLASGSKSGGGHGSPTEAAT